MRRLDGGGDGQSQAPFMNPVPTWARLQSSQQVAAPLLFLAALFNDSRQVSAECYCWGLWFGQLHSTFEGDCVAHQEMDIGFGRWRRCLNTTYSGKEEEEVWVWNYPRPGSSKLCPGCLGEDVW